MGEQVCLRAIGSRTDERPRRGRGPAFAKQTQCGVSRPTRDGESENPDASLGSSVRFGRGKPFLLHTKEKGPSPTKPTFHAGFDGIFRQDIPVLSNNVRLVRFAARSGPRLRRGRSPMRAPKTQGNRHTRASGNLWAFTSRHREGRYQ